MSFPCLLSCCLAAVALACSTDEDCALNGVCRNEICLCNGGWIGASCGQLDLLPAATTPLNGYNVPNTSSWGAGVIYDLASQLYHMWVAEFINHCGLLTWHNNSRVIHATSPTATGPYTFVDETISVYSHNPTVARTRDGRGVILMHIGGGAPDGQPDVCINGSSQPGNVSAAGSLSRVSRPPHVDTASVGTLCSSGPSAAFVSCNWTGEPGFTNPTLWVDRPSGDIMTGGNSNYSLVLSRGRNCSNFNCASWPPLTEVTPGRTCEDPWIWQVGIYLRFHA
jgi:hypothetical protein